MATAISRHVVPRSRRLDAKAMQAVHQRLRPPVGQEMGTSVPQRWQLTWRRLRAMAQPAVLSAVPGAWCPRLLALVPLLPGGASAWLAARVQGDVPLGGHGHTPLWTGHQPVTTCTARHTNPISVNVSTVSTAPLDTDASCRISAMANADDGRYAEHAAPPSQWATRGIVNRFMAARPRRGRSTAPCLARVACPRRSPSRRSRYRRSTWLRLRAVAMAAVASAAVPTSATACFSAAQRLSADGLPGGHLGFQIGDQGQGRLDARVDLRDAGFDVGDVLQYPRRTGSSGCPPSGEVAGGTAGSWRW